MKERIFKWFIGIVICLILQTTIVPLISIFGVQPDFLIIILFFLSLKHGVLPGIYIGFFLGLGQDIYSPTLLGQNALAKTIMGAFFGLFNEKIMRTDPLIKIIILVIGFFVNDTIFSIAELIKNDNSLSFLIIGLFSRTFPRAVYTVFVVSLIFFWNYTIQPNLKK